MPDTLKTTIIEPARLDRVVQSLTGLSRAGVRGLLDHGRVRVNDRAAAHGQAIVQPGDIVEINHDPHTRLRERPKVRDDPAYRILFEDEHLLVVNKAAHVLTVPTESGKGKTLIAALERHVNHGLPSGAHRRLHVVHRLDLGVSGVMVVAKTAAAATAIKDQFAAHKPQRLYLAVVNGRMAETKGTFRSHLATDGSLNRYSTKKAGHGELAVTHYEVVSHAKGATVVRVRLETGRRNQIRVHFAEAGHPVLGDPRYPRDADPAPVSRQPKSRKQAKSQATATILSSLHPKWKARRIALHARSLQFEHPTTGKLMRFEADIPVEFQHFMSAKPSAKDAR